MPDSSVQWPSSWAESTCVLFCTSVILNFIITSITYLPSTHSALTDAALSKLANRLIVSFVYSHDVVSRLSLGSVRDLKNAALWLCDAEGSKNPGEGWGAVTARAKQWKRGAGSPDDPDWVCLHSLQCLINSLTDFCMRPVYRRAHDARGEHADVEYVPAGARLVGNARQ